MQRQGDKREAQQAALRAQNTTWAAFSWQSRGAARQDLTRGSVPVPWCPVLPINALGFPEHQERKFRRSFEVILG